MYSQKTDISHVPKKITKILLATDFSKESNFGHVIEMLLDNDYTIARDDEKYGTIKTDMRPLKGLNGSYYLNIRTKDNEIIISGQFVLNIRSHPSMSDIINKGMKGSANNKSFIAMYEFAEKLTFITKEYDY